MLLELPLYCVVVELACGLYSKGATNTVDYWGR